MPKFTFHQGPGRYDQKVTLDGEDISRFVRAVSIDADVSNAPSVRLDLAVFEIESATEAKIHIAPGTEDLLARLGWTPPVEGI